MELPDGEPRSGPWRARPVVDVLRAVLGVDEVAAARSVPLLLAVDGRSGSGKTTVARRILDRVPGAAVVHTDDVAWYHAMFDWSSLITEGVLAPLRRGEPVAFRPPPWDARARPGAVTVPAGRPLVVVEGVGIGRRGLAPFFDGLLWVQTDRALARVRGIARDGGDAAAEAFWDEWEAAERPFLAAERPWERADAIVDGAPTLPHEPATDLLVADALSPPCRYRS